MKIDIGNFYITDFCKENILHCRFRRQLASDSAFLQRGFYRIEEQLTEPTNKNKLEPNNSYIIEDKEGNLVGYLRLGNLNFIGTITLEYGIHKDFRGEKYAYPLLKELTDYILKYMNDVKEIRGDISIYNVKSIKIAEGVGYQSNGRNDQNIDYRYSREGKKR